MSVEGKNYQINEFVRVAESPIKQVVENSMEGLVACGFTNVDYLYQASWAVLNGEGIHNSLYRISLLGSDPYLFTMTFGRYDGAELNRSSYSAYQAGFYPYNENSDVVVEELSVVVAEWVGKQIDDNE